MRRNWLIAAVVVGVLVIVGAVVAARLADDDFTSVDTTEWAGSVCTNLSEWQGSLQSIGAGAQGAPSVESLESALDDARSATDELVQDLHRLGPPDLDTGDNEAWLITPVVNVYFTNTVILRAGFDYYTYAVGATQFSAQQFIMSWQANF